MATFGNTDYGNTAFDPAVDTKYASKFTLGPAGGLVSKLSLACSSSAGSGVAQYWKGVIYSDNSGSPDDLLAVTQEYTMYLGESYAYRDLVFSTDVELAAGDYWLGLIAGAGANASVRILPDGDHRQWNSDTYSDGPSDPYGSTSSGGGGPLCIYATYVPYCVGTGALQIGSPSLSGAMHMDITGTGALQTAPAALSGAMHMDVTGTGVLTTAAAAISGRTWMDSAHLRHLGGRAMLWGVKGRAGLWGLKGKASM